MKASLMCVFLSVFMFTFDWYKLKNRLPFIRCNVANEHPYHIPPIGNTHTHTQVPTREGPVRNDIKIGNENGNSYFLFVQCASIQHALTLFISYSLSLPHAHTLAFVLASNRVKFQFHFPNPKSKTVSRRAAKTSRDATHRHRPHSTWNERWPDRVWIVSEKKETEWAVRRQIISIILEITH